MVSRLYNFGRLGEALPLDTGKTKTTSEYWENNKEIPVNERQRKVINRLLDGFEGKLTSSKWAKLVKCSSDTALRNIEDLVRKGLLVKEGTGRGTYYELKS